MSVGKRALLVFLILNGRAKTKLAIVAFLCCGRIVKNSSVFTSVFSNHFMYLLCQ